MAILAGDALLTLAFEVLARDIQPPAWPPSCCAALAEAAGATALVGGQADDLDGRILHGDLATLEAIHRRKTGAMFLVSLATGRLCRRRRRRLSKRPWNSYGRKLGLAFQIADDLLDVAGDEAAMGKRVGKDSERGKLTFPGLLGVEESRRRAQRLDRRGLRGAGALGRKTRRAWKPWPAMFWKGITEWTRCSRRSNRRAICRGCPKLQLEQLAGEMREALCNLVTNRTAHFASNLGVVELCLALHTTFDFSRDRLIWDTGHQIYPHKLITGRYHEFGTIRTKGGLMGYPNPHESDYDLFMTGHAGCSVSTALGLKSGDDLMPARAIGTRWP